METDYFGPATMAALQAFQAANGIVSSGDPRSTGYGNLGPITLAKINSYYPTSPDPTTQAPTQSTNPQALQDNYGYEQNQAAENKAVGALDGFMNLLTTKNTVGGPISTAEMNKIANDHTLMATYLNALSYGGYSLQDVYKDMMRQNLVDTGQGNLVQGASPISSQIEAPAYKASAAYNSVAGNQNLAVPPTIAGLDSSVLTLPLLQMPDAAFNAVTPLPDPNSPEFRQKMEEYKSATFEAAMEIAKAQTETERTKAMADWQSTKDEISKALGINLSANAVSAWNQISSFQRQSASNNIAGSGIEAQQIDQYLKQQMGLNDKVREQYQTAEDKAKMNYYQNFASPNEIMSLIKSDPKDAQAWGLTPTSDIKSYLTISNLSKLYPGTPQQDLQAIIDKYMDGNGNLYSKLYSNYASANVDTSQSYDEYKASKVLDAQKAADDKSLAQYSDPNNPFLRPDGSIATNQKPVPAGQSSTLVKANGPGSANPAPTYIPTQTQSSSSTYVAPASSTPVTPKVTVPTNLTNPGSPAPTNTGLGAGLSISPGGGLSVNGYQTPSTSGSPALTGSSSTGTPKLDTPMAPNLGGIINSLALGTYNGVNSIAKGIGGLFGLK